MAYLRNLLTGETVYLLNHHTFGRRLETVDTCIPYPEISQIHAVIEWNGRQWEIRDLGRNGTWLNQKKLPSASSVVLEIGHRINFANQPNHEWQIECVAKPANILLGLNEQTSTQPITQYHLLPDIHNPVAALYQCSRRGQWILEPLNSSDVSIDINETSVNPGDEIELGECRWRLVINGEQQHTVDLTNHQHTSENCEFEFDVSLDEEHIELTLKYQGMVASLGERSHHYLLLHLARLKDQHAQQGLDHTYQGWISNELLARDLGIGVSHINIQIFRARKQISEAFPELFGITDLLQRRRGEVRFNCSLVKINKGDQIEYLFS